MSDIYQFLSDRLDEDEAAAKAATPGPWQPDEPLLADFVGSRATMKHIADCSVGTGYREGSIADAAHIARHDPARVLAEVKAKRALIAAAAEMRASDHWGLAFFADTIERNLAVPYAEHPDYKQEWSAE